MWLFNCGRWTHSWQAQTRHCLMSLVALLGRFMCCFFRRNFFASVQTTTLQVQVIIIVIIEFVGKPTENDDDDNINATLERPNNSPLLRFLNKLSMTDLGSPSTTSYSPLRPTPITDDAVKRHNFRDTFFIGTIAIAGGARAQNSTNDRWLQPTTATPSNTTTATVKCNHNLL